MFLQNWTEMMLANCLTFKDNEIHLTKVSKSSIASISSVVARLSIGTPLAKVSTTIASKTTIAIASISSSIVARLSISTPLAKVSATIASITTIASISSIAIVARIGHSTGHNGENKNHLHLGS